MDFAAGFRDRLLSPAQSRTDVIGVEVCAAFKNFFAIAVGWAAGHCEKPAADREQRASTTMPRPSSSTRQSAS
jgi:glycerol-3-phosphate dehydrogenase